MRRRVLLFSALLATVGGVWIADAATIDGQLRCGNPLPMSARGRRDRPIRVVAEVVAVRRLKGVHRGDRCQMLVSVHPMSTGGLDCRTAVECAGRTVYGGPELGYFPCAVYTEPRTHVVGSDTDTTASDGDAAMQLDTPSRMLRVWDDARGRHGAFELEAEVLRVK